MSSRKRFDPTVRASSGPGVGLLLQPPNSTLCGQYCVAMLAAVAPEESIAVFGTRGRTRTAEVVKALTHFGLRPSSRLRRLSQYQVIPSPSILKVARPGQSNFHWVVFQEGVIYCPCLGEVNYHNYSKVIGKSFIFNYFLSVN